MKKIREAGLVAVPNPHQDINQDKDVYAPGSDDDLLLRYAEELNGVQGSFVYCEDEKDLVDNLYAFLEVRAGQQFYCNDETLLQFFREHSLSFNSAESPAAVDVAFTRCEALVARLGSVLVSSAMEQGRRPNFSPDAHVVIAEKSQLVATVDDGLRKIAERYGRMPSMITNITGPSRTADIEKTLVMGSHGPKDLVVFVVEEMKKLLNG